MQSGLLSALSEDVNTDLITTTFAPAITSTADKNKLLSTFLTILTAGIGVLSAGVGFAASQALTGVAQKVVDKGASAASAVIGGGLNVQRQSLSTYGVPTSSLHHYLTTSPARSRLCKTWALWIVHSARSRRTYNRAWSLTLQAW